MKPYKQTLSHSCLVACFLMLLQKKGIDPKIKDEQEITLKGMDRKYPFYVVGVPKEIFNKYKEKINLVVDNNYFKNILVKSFNDKKNFNAYHKKINLKLIKDLLKEHSLICHIDDNYFGDYSHASHFIVLEKATNKKMIIIDPWSGKKNLISDRQLEDSILSLKKHIKMCPLLFYLK